MIYDVFKMLFIEICCTHISPFYRSWFRSKYCKIFYLPVFDGHHPPNSDAYHLSFLFKLQTFYTLISFKNTKSSRQFLDDDDDEYPSNTSMRNRPDFDDFCTSLNLTLGFNTRSIASRSIKIQSAIFVLFWQWKLVLLRFVIRYMI